MAHYRTGRIKSAWALTRDLSPGRVFDSSFIRRTVCPLYFLLVFRHHGAIPTRFFHNFWMESTMGVSAINKGEPTRTKNQGGVQWRTKTRKTDQPTTNRSCRRRKRRMQGEKGRCEAARPLARNHEDTAELGALSRTCRSQSLHRPRRRRAGETPHWAMFLAISRGSACGCQTPTAASCA